MPENPHYTHNIINMYDLDYWCEYIPFSFHMNDTLGTH